MDEAPPEQQLWQLPDGELAEALLGAEARLCRDYGQMLALVSEAHSRDLARTLGYGDSVKLLAEALRLSTREARARVQHAEASVAGRAVSGGEIPPPMPATGQALAAGEINAEHVQELGRVLIEVARRVDAEACARAEVDLVELARQSVPAAVRTAGRRLLAYLDQDGKRPRDDEAEQENPKRSFRYHYGRQGWMHFDGKLDPESAAQLDGLFGTLAKPESNADGQPDHRCVERRQGDALAEIIDLAARADELSTQGGERAVVTVTMSLEELEARARDALLHVPGSTSAAALRRLCCEAKVVPAVLGGSGEVLDLGRASRLASPAQRRSLVLRDKGCAYPGCGRPPKWCTPHHIIPWAEGGNTDLSNLVLVCARHHRRIHHSAWTVRIRENTTEFIPPEWMDPRRRPMRNTAHDPPGQQRAA